MKIKKEINFDLKQLRSFIEVIKEKSFTRASRKLRLGQATISHHIHLLEEMTGSELIHRTSRGLTITDAGRAFHEFCVKLFTDIERVKLSMAGEPPGVVTKISASTIPSTYILPVAIAAVRKRYPHFVYAVESADSREVLEIVKAGDAEIGVVGKRVRHPSLAFHHILTDEIVLIGSPRHPDSIQPEQLKELPLITRESGSGTRTAYEKELSRHTIAPALLNPVFECSTSECMKESVIAGIGAAFISRLAIEREIHLKKVKIIRIRGLVVKRDFYAVSPKSHVLSHPAQALVHELKRH